MKGGLLMAGTLSRLHDRLRRRFVGISRSLSKLFASVAPPVRGYASQRMCPFCGLITPRARTFCFECGKSLAPARS
jgi:hypothetical protein